MSAFRSFQDEIEQISNKARLDKPSSVASTIPAGQTKSTTGTKSKQSNGGVEGLVEKTKGIKITAAGAETAETVGGANARRKSVEVDSGNETEEGVEGLDSRLEKDNANLDPEEGRTLEDRLINPTHDTILSIASLLDPQIDLCQGEILLSIGSHNLEEKVLAAILEGEEETQPAPASAKDKDAKTATTTTTAAAAAKRKSLQGKGGKVLTKEQVEAALSTLTQVAEEIRCKASILYSPNVASTASPTIGLNPSAIPNSTTAGPTSAADPLPPTVEHPASVNEEAITERWGSGRSARFLLRRIPDSAQDLIELRVAVVGQVDAGKSTLLGVLTKGRLDDGRGRARVSLFRHKHELESGRTSSVGMEIMGFDSTGQEVLPEGAIAAMQAAEAANNALSTTTTTTTTTSSSANGSNSASLIHQQANMMQPGLRKQQLSWDEIAKRAAKVISFIDLAGHERYLKTTIFGLTGCAPNFVLLIIGANAGLIGMSKEHLSVALALAVPVVCVVTKVDMTPPNIVEQTLKQLTKILRSPGCRKTPVFVKDRGMACELAKGFVKEKACPIFMVSNVTGQGLDSLKTFLNALPSVVDGQYSVDQDLEFSISDVFSVPFVGTVVSGVILSGQVKTGDTVLIGPDSLGHFTTTSIKAMQRKRVNVNQAHAGQSVSFALKRVRRENVRKGMVIVPKSDDPPRAVRKFEGQVLVLYHNTTIQPKYQAMLHCGSVRQTVRIVSMDKGVIRTGDRATVVFEFIKSPEYVKVGSRVLMREGKTRCLGVVTRVNI